jgi:transcriptional regulator with XRE-family HTH domain
MERASVGTRIRELRRSKNLSGKDLAERTGFSAAAISKFERGLLRPNQAFIDKVIEALELSTNDAHALKELGAFFNSQFQRWSLNSDEVEHIQELVGQRESNASSIRCFNNQVIPGLLQSESYMRAVFASLSGKPGEDLNKLVKARRHRQRILAQRKRTFVFVLGEGSLRSSFQSPSILRDQLEHLEKLATKFSNLEIRILPFSKTLTRFVLHHFVLYDERSVNIEVIRGDLDLWTPDDVNYYIELMNYLVSASLPLAKSKEMISSLKREMSQ